MAAKGRRIKRRGSGRSSCDGDEGLLQPQQPQQAQQAQQQQQPAAAAAAGGPSAQTEPSTVSGNSVSEAPMADCAENARMHQLLEAQKRTFEVGRAELLLCFFARPLPAAPVEETVPHHAYLPACLHASWSAPLLMLRLHAHSLA